MNNIKCPICSYDKNELVYVQKFSAHFEHKIVSCLFCGFTYVKNIPSQNYYSEYYKNQSKYEGTRLHETHDRFTSITINYILNKFISKEALILDVGCSTGKLLKFIKQKGYKKLLGIEPAPECKLYAKKNYGINVMTSSLENFKTKKKYDLIIFSQVLEHLVNLKEIIIKTHDLLKDDGMVFIGVPDADNFHNKFEEPYGEFSTEHINFFTRKTLSILMNGFSKIFEKTDNNIILTLWKKNTNDNKSIKIYINKSTEKMKKIIKIIKLLQKDTIIWGVGALTQRLLKTTNIKTKIFKFVDSNENLIGKKIDNIEIISPDELIKYHYPVLVSSFGYKDEIIEEIQKRGYVNKIITFQ